MSQDCPQYGLEIRRTSLILSYQKSLGVPEDKVNAFIADGHLGLAKDGLAAK